MSRIIELCGDCSWLAIHSLGEHYCMKTNHPAPIPYIGEEDREGGEGDFPSFCPLPKLDDKMREVWKASREMVQTHLSGDGEYKFRSYEEWRKQNEH